MPTPSDRHDCPLPDPFPRIRRLSPSAVHERLAHRSRFRGVRGCVASTRPPCRYRPALASWVRRRVRSGDSLPALRGATCGDINPDRLVGAFQVADEFRVARGAADRDPQKSRPTHPLRRAWRTHRAKSQPANPCRWPPTPAVPAINCCARLICQGAGLRIRSLFQFRRVTFVPDDGANYIAPARKTARFRESEKTVIHHPAQLLARHPLDR